MGLQLRIRHALGVRVLEVEPRDASNPLRIGRGADADVQIPVGIVAPLHCYLYFEDGRWIIQDAGSTWGTRVNDRPATEPVYLAGGEIITLGAGASAPTIEVVPRTAGQVVRPAVPPPIQPTPGETENPAEDVQNAQSPESEQPPEEQIETSDVAEDEQWPLEGAGAGASGGSRRRRPPRRSRSKDQGNQTALVIGLSAAVVILVIILIAVLGRKDKPAPPPPVVENPDPMNASGKKSIFDFGRQINKPKTPDGQPPPTRPITTQVPPSAPPDTPAGPIDPRKQEESWQVVEQAHLSDDPARAIWACEDYRARFPDRFSAELDRYAAEALDQLWWRRIKELCDRRDQLAGDMGGLDKQIADENEAEYKVKLQKERKNLEDQRSGIVEAITVDMGYSGSAAPNLLDTSQLATLRGQRDAAKYSTWCEQVRRSLRTTMRLPWQVMR